MLAFLLANLILDEPRVSYRSGWRAGLSDLTDIFIRWLMVLCLAIALLKIAALLHTYDRSMLALWAVLAPTGMWSRAAFFAANRCRTCQRGGGARRAVIVGVSDVGIRLENRLSSSPAYSTKVLGFFEDRCDERVPADYRPRILGKAR